MGFVSWLLGTPGASTGTPMLASPYSGDSLEPAIVGDFFGIVPTETVTRDIARRIPELKRALKAHQALVSPLRFEKWTPGAEEADENQPYWVSSCNYPHMSRYLAYKMLVSELYWEGVALLACRLDTEGNVWDWVTLTRDLWTVDRSTGDLTVKDTVPADYRARYVFVQLGDGGVLADAIDSIRQARKLDAARAIRLDTPPAGVELHITDVNRDEMTRKEKAKVAADYTAIRQKNGVSVTPSFVQVKTPGANESLDLFEGAKNSLRLELAMHGGVPASFIEGAKEGGTGGTMTYSNENDRQSELWTYGSAEYAYAITAALSGDDVVGEGAEVRADLSHFSAPAPTSIDPEAGDASQEETP